MTIVLLHGVPETAELWDDVRKRLDQPSVALRLPGFGCPRPEGFSATKDAYVDWLVGELKRFDEPVDLIGHDWGGGLSIRLGTTYPDLVRSWASDCVGILHSDYEWHDFAKIWQTPGDGEAFFEQQATQSPQERAGVLQMFGLDEKAALKLAGMSDPVMSTCILDLYRSAMPNAYVDWATSLAKSAKPCLVMMPSDDPFTAGHLAPKVADVLGAETVEFSSGHFWPLQVPDVGAKIINEFVASVG